MAKKKKKITKKKKPVVIEGSKPAGIILDDLEPSLDDPPDIPTVAIETMMDPIDPYDMEKDETHVGGIDEAPADENLPEQTVEAHLATLTHVYMHPACQSPAFYLMRAPAIGEDIARAMLKFNAEGLLIGEYEKRIDCLHCGSVLSQLHHRHVKET